MPYLREVSVSLMRAVRCRPKTDGREDDRNGQREWQRNRWRRTVLTVLFVHVSRFSCESQATAQGRGHTEFLNRLKRLSPPSCHLTNNDLRKGGGPRRIRRSEAQGGPLRKDVTPQSVATRLQNFALPRTKRTCRTCTPVARRAVSSTIRTQPPRVASMKRSL